MSDRPISALLRLVEEAKVLAGGKHPCNVLGHEWRHIGGAWCGCEGRDDAGDRWSGRCSVPVHRCDACGDYDYGVNADAQATRAQCAEGEA